MAYYQLYVYAKILKYKKALQKIENAFLPGIRGKSLFI
tara:strand:- start:178 stop:291 length:114 start_codon:yes stop_codon:yes gene_type:complete